LGRRPHSRAAGVRRITRSRRFASVTTTHVCASASASATTCDGPKQSVVAGTTDRPVSTGPIVVACSISASARARQAAFVDRTPLLRFSIPLQHTLAAMRCPGRDSVDSTKPWPASGRSRFGVFASPTRALLRDRSVTVRPCGFSPVGGAKRRRSQLPDVRSGTRFRRNMRRVTRRLTVALQDQLPSSSIDSCRWGRGNRSHVRERSGRSSAIASIRRPNRVMHRRVPSAWCSATRDSSFRSLAGRMVLPSVRPAALMGFLPFAVLLRTG